ncbi:PHD-finger domain-containing protein [Colletotrichum orchidophilum]|uniref:PHD-finger domain-containing protein n=1 Tax=Colletotrichum orchidophilum TaxID=1209926 RepID=A0A1G4B2B8_9PEZI|nr:PHD-finger domain-containing protein [Colletotrichum orchidophilum]OHE95475.1 PHD-finger domain-containing protein [Colletotrichum orchidophilum]
MPSKTREASDSERLPVWSKARRSGALESPVAMMPTSTRATRSRFSSPHQHANGGGGSEPVKKTNGASEASRTFMQKWLEPTVQSKPSFEEAGLMRYGVTENMAPLGTLPKGPPTKKQGQEGVNPVRKIILKSSSANSAVAAAAKAAAAAAAAAGAADATMAKRSETPPRLPSPPANAQKATRKCLPARGLGDDDEEDEDYTPKAATGKSQGRRASASQSRKSVSRSSVGRRASASLHQMAPSSDAVQPSESTPENKDVIERAVEVAIDEALRHYRYPTAWALRTLYDENSSNPVFLSMFEDVYHQTADEDTLDEFSRLIEEKKREGKKDNQACYFFVPPSTNSRFTPHKPKPAPYGNLLSLDLSKSDYDDDDDDDLLLQVTPTKKASKRREIPESPMDMDMDDDDETTLLAAETTLATMTPSRKRARRDSASSDSSLSELSASPSLPPDSPSPSSPPVSAAVKGDSHNRRHSATTAATAAGADPEITLTSAPPPAEPEPMKRRGRSLAAKTSVSDASNPNSPTLPPNVSQAAGASSMPGRLSSPIFPNLSTTAPSKAAGKKNANKDKGPRVLPSDDATTQRRRDARDSTVSQTPQPESHIRGSDMRSRAGSVATSSPAVNLRKSARTPAPNSNLPVNLTLSTRTTRSAKRTHDEIDNTSSPTALFSLGEVTPAASSRAATPTNLRPSKKQRTGLRIKTSPMKKKGGTAAGLPRASGEGGAVNANGGPINQDENDDYCSACSGVGELVCCENCSRSFHFECVDLGLGDTLPEEWFCNVCFSSRYPTRVPEHKGPFGGLMNTLEKTNPRAYKLPQGVRVYFESVKVGPEGEYEDVVVPAKPKKKGYEEAPDFFKVRDADGSAVLCHNCQHPSADNRAIIPCSLCGLHWHLDCLDPPLAIPPVVRTWRCPAHADDLLATLPEELAPAHRFRKIKGTPVIIPAFSRGMRNNGYIEIDDEDEESEDENSGWSDVKSFGRVYKLSSKGVVLDFISQLRKDGAGHISSSPASTKAQPPPTSQPLNARSRVEQQAVLNLVELASTQPTTKLNELTEALLTNAEPAMLSLMARGSVGNFASGDLNATDKQSLRAMLAQMEAMTGRIRGLLGDDQKDSGVFGMDIESDQNAIDSNHINGTGSAEDTATSIKNESVEPPADLPTPATTTQDNPEPINSLGEKSSQEAPNDANEDDVTDMDID